MCFSAGASFAAGAVLSIIGVGSIRKAQSPSQVLFASIPLVFSVQQVSEGVLWLALQNSKFESLAPLATYLFLFFAQVLWPLRGNRLSLSRLLFVEISSGGPNHGISYLLWAGFYHSFQPIWRFVLCDGHHCSSILFECPQNVALRVFDLHFVYHHAGLLHRLHRIGLVLFCRHHQHFNLWDYARRI